MQQSSDPRCGDSPAALVAIIRAARLAGDRDLERAARRELRDRHGIEITFRRDDEPRTEVARA